MTNFYCFAAAALPALLFTLLSEIFSALLHMAADAAAARGLLHISVGLLDALITALSLTAAGAAFLRPAKHQLFVWKTKEDRNNGAIVKEELPHSVRVVSGIFGVVALALLLNGLLLSAGVTGRSQGGSQAAADVTAAPVFAAVLIYGIVTPFTEELIFRGLTYSGLRLKNYGKPAAMLTASILFGLYHGNLPQGIYAFCMSMVFCEAYEESRSFPLIFGMHAAVNLAALAVSYGGLSGLLLKPGWMAFLCAAAFLCLFAAEGFPRKTQK